MNVLTSAAQIAAHDLAAGVRNAARPQQAPRRLDIADLAELDAKPVRPAEKPNPAAVAASAAPDTRAPAPQGAAESAERRPVRPGTLLDIRV